MMGTLHTKIAHSEHVRSDPARSTRWRWDRTAPADPTPSAAPPIPGCSSMMVKMAWERDEASFMFV